MNRALLLPILASLALPAQAARAQDGRHLLQAVLIAPASEGPAGNGPTQNDIEDVAAALRRAGVSAITRLTGAAASPGRVRGALEELRTSASDGSPALVLYAGEGGADPPGEAILRLSGGETLRLRDLDGLTQAVEARGGRVALILDTCFGGEAMRDVDARAARLTYRCPQGRAPEPQAGAELSLRMSAAADGVRVPETLTSSGAARGALSLALARGLEGGADLDGDGTITFGELRSYVTDLAYQISDQRQLPASSAKAPDSIFARPPPTRGFAVRPVGVPAPAAQNAPEEKPGIKITPVKTAPRVKITALNSPNLVLQDVAPPGKAEVVDSIEGADLIWDAARREVLVGGDVIAQRVDRSEIPNVIERVAAGKDLKERAATAPLPVRVTPAGGRNRRGAVVSVQIDGVARQNMIIMNLTGNGKVQMLYPRGKEPILITQPAFRISYQVVPPFGADLFVAMASTQDLGPLRDALQSAADEGGAKRAIDSIAKLAPADLKIGAANVFTTQ